MKILLAFIVCFLVPVIASAAQPSVSQEKAESQADQTLERTPMVEDMDGDLKLNEYEPVSPNGGITRAICPYTCEMRGVPQQYCRTWRSQIEPHKCYVQDKRIPSEAIRIDNRTKAEK